MTHSQPWLSLSTQKQTIVMDGQRPRQTLLQSLTMEIKDNDRRHTLSSSHGADFGPLFYGVHPLRRRYLYTKPACHAPLWANLQWKKTRSVDINPIVKVLRVLSLSLQLRDINLENITKSQ